MTSIEWLIEQFKDYDFLLSLHQFDIEQAKEMHKQEMKEMYLKGIENYDPTFKRKYDTFKVWECCGMEECICKHPSVISENGNELLFDKEGNLIKELPKQETLYTEEQVREVIRNCFKSNSLGFLITEDDMMRTIKQPKKD